MTVRWVTLEFEVPPHLQCHCGRHQNSLASGTVLANIRGTAHAMQGSGDRQQAAGLLCMLGAV
jgi:hypothetical protein